MRSPYPRAHAGTHRSNMFPENDFNKKTLKKVLSVGMPGLGVFKDTAEPKSLVKFMSKPAEQLVGDEEDADAFEGGEEPMHEDEDAPADENGTETTEPMALVGAKPEAEGMDPYTEFKEVYNAAASFHAHPWSTPNDRVEAVVEMVESSLIGRTTRKIYNAFNRCFSGSPEMLRLNAKAYSSQAIYFAAQTNETGSELRWSKKPWKSGETLVKMTFVRNIRNDFHPHVANATMKSGLEGEAARDFEWGEALKMHDWYVERVRLGVIALKEHKEGSGAVFTEEVVCCRIAAVVNALNLLYKFCDPASAPIYGSGLPARTMYERFAKVERFVTEVINNKKKTNKMELKAKGAPPPYPRPV